MHVCSMYCLREFVISLNLFFCGLPLYVCEVCCLECVGKVGDCYVL